MNYTVAASRPLSGASHQRCSAEKVAAAAAAAANVAVYT